MHSDVYHAISDPTRRRILDLLASGELDVSALGQPFAISQPAVSKHLRVLREAGLVTSRVVGKHRHYQLTPQPLREVTDWLSHYQRFWGEKLKALERHLDRAHPREKENK